MPQIDPQEFGEVKANVTSIIKTLERIEPKLDGLVTKEQLEENIKPVKELAGDVDKRLRVVEDYIKLEKSSYFTKIKEIMGSTIATIVAIALVIGLGMMVVTYFYNTYQQNTNQPKSVIDIQEGK